MIKLIIFDFDGVIITGSHEEYFNCYHKALEKVGIQLGPKEERRRILEYFSFSNKETVYVGDAENDVIMARRAGVIPIVVLTGHLKRENAEKLGVNHIISDINHLGGILSSF